MKQKVLEYNTIFQKEPEGFSVWVPSLPGCTSQGENFEEALKNIEEAIALYLEDEKTKDSDASVRDQFMVPVKLTI